MRIWELFHQYKLIVIEAILLMTALAGLWRINNVFLSFVCGVSAGLLFYRLGERIAQHRIRKA
ncbi:hypothetical protein [Chitinophaga sp. HK235]|uniref:hypothetical protein n=1 Tax=Chitinophaga sp. HK235 TaxID=2952571 RepID=UPI001BA90044|nr:hypothetical protein [Chitinophaga sp. HK235]